MKKNIMIAVVVSILMIAGFGVFLFFMSKNSDKIKQEEIAKNNSELGIISLQGEHYYSKFNTQTEYNDLYLTGDNKNVLSFDTSDAVNVYNVSVSETVHNQLVRMQDKKDYNFDNPLIAYNPYGTNTCSLYMYFETKSECFLRYTVTFENEEIPDFVRTMNDSDGSGYLKHEYLISGLLPGTTNYLNLELVSKKGEYVDSKVYRIDVPESGYGNKVSIENDMAKNVEKMTNGLFFCYGTGNNCIALYDNSGYLRGEIPLIEECVVPVCVNNADMLVAYSNDGIARLSRTGQVLATYKLGNYKLGKRMLYNSRGQILVVASDKGRNTVNDVILNIDMESGNVKVAADMQHILEKAHKKMNKGSKAKDAEYFEIESMEFINNNDLLINSENLSSIIKLKDIMSENPTVSYIIGSKKRWNIKGYSDKLMKKESLENMETEADPEDKEEKNDEKNDTEERVNILEENNKELFEDMNGNVSLVYEPIASEKKDEGEDNSGRYYISVLNNNNGKDTSYQKYMVNEDEKTYCLVSDTKTLQNDKGGSMHIIGDNYVVCQGEKASFAEYGRDGKAIIQYRLKTGTVIKNSMKNFWFR